MDSRPGELFVVGEYAVVENGEPAVLVAVDRFLSLRLIERENASLAATSTQGRAAIQIVDEFAHCARTERAPF